MFSQDGSPLESIQTCTKKFRAMSMELTHPTATDAAGYDICGGAQAEGGNKMVEYLPIEWWDSVHGDDNDMTKQMKRITAPTVPLIRQFGNTAVMDVLVCLPHVSECVFSVLIIAGMCRCTRPRNFKTALRLMSAKR